MGIEDLKSPARLLNRDQVNKGGLDLSKKVLWVTVHWWTYITVRQVFSKSFLSFQAPSENILHTNDTSLERPIKELLEFCKRMSMAPS